MTFRLLKNLPAQKVYDHIRQSIADKKCSACDAEVHELRDQLSLKEYNQSGLCQGCQDAFFTEV